MIGLLGGTFDPIHYGHLRPAHEVLHAAGLEQLRVIPAANPPHRSLPVATVAERWRMVELALQEFPEMIADDREIRRTGPSYTVPTLIALAAEVPEQTLCLLLGEDAFLGIPQWHQSARLFELANIIVMRRPGSTLPDPEDAAFPPWAVARVRANVAELCQTRAGGVLLMSVTPQDISATRLRAAIAQREAWAQQWLPPSVWQYIRDRGLYQRAA